MGRGSWCRGTLNAFDRRRPGRSHGRELQVPWASSRKRGKEQTRKWCMYTRTGFGDSAAAGSRTLKSPEKPTEKMFQVWLYQPVLFTPPLSAQAGQPAWHSPSLTQGERQAEKTSCQETRHSVGPRQPHNAHPASALQNLLGAKSYQTAFRKTVPTPKKMRVS